MSDPSRGGSVPSPFLTNKKSQRDEKKRVHAHSRRDVPALRWIWVDGAIAAACRAPTIFFPEQSDPH